MFSRHVAWETKQGAAIAGVSDAGFQQGGAVEQSGGWTPPVTPPLPLSPLPNYPQQYPSYPNGPLEYPPQQPGAGNLLGQLFFGLFGGQATGNLLLIAILGWQLYRGFAKSKGIPLILDDAAAAQLTQVLRQSPPQQTQNPVSRG